MKKLLFFLLISPFAQAQTQATIDSDGSTLYYRTFGTGSPLLIINGGPGMNSDGFASLAEELSANNLVILYDQRGTGKSTLKKVGATTVTMDLMVADIENLRKHLGFKKWAVLGHSFGGMLASHYACLYPKSIDKLIFSSSGGLDLDLQSYVSIRINSKLTATQRDSLAYFNQKLTINSNDGAARKGRARLLAPAYVYNKNMSQ